MSSCSRHTSGLRISLSVVKGASVVRLRARSDLLRRAIGVGDNSAVCISFSGAAKRSENVLPFYLVRALILLT